MLQSCLTLCDPMDCSLPGFSVHGFDSPGKNTGVGCHFLLHTYKLLSLTCSLKIRFFFFWSFSRLSQSDIGPFFYCFWNIELADNYLSYTLYIFILIDLIVGLLVIGPIFNYSFLTNFFFFSWKLLPSLSFDHNYRDRNVNIHKDRNGCIWRWSFFPCPV